MVSRGRQAPSPIVLPDGLNDEFRADFDSPTQVPFMVGGKESAARELIRRVKQAQAEADSSLAEVIHLEHACSNLNEQVQVMRDVLESETKTMEQATQGRSALEEELELLKQQCYDALYANNGLSCMTSSNEFMIRFRAWLAQSCQGWRDASSLYLAKIKDFQHGGIVDAAESSHQPVADSSSSEAESMTSHKWKSVLTSFKEGPHAKPVVGHSHSVAKRAPVTRHGVVDTSVGGALPSSFGVKPAFSRVLQGGSALDDSVRHLDATEPLVRLNKGNTLRDAANMKDTSTPRVLSNGTVLSSRIRQRESGSNSCSSGGESSSKSSYSDSDSEVDDAAYWSQGGQSRCKPILYPTTEIGKEVMGEQTALVSESEQRMSMEVGGGAQETGRGGGGLRSHQRGTSASTVPRLHQQKEFARDGAGVAWAVKERAAAAHIGEKSAFGASPHNPFVRQYNGLGESKGASPRPPIREPASGPRAQRFHHHEEGVDLSEGGPVSSNNDGGGGGGGGGGQPGGHLAPQSIRSPRLQQQRADRKASMFAMPSPPTKQGMELKSHMTTRNSISVQLNEDCRRKPLRQKLNEARATEVLEKSKRAAHKTTKRRVSILNNYSKTSADVSSTHSTSDKTHAAFSESSQSSGSDY